MIKVVHHAANKVILGTTCDVCQVCVTHRNDLLNIEAAGVSHPRARFVSLEAQRMKLSVPIIKEVGPANIVAYIVLDGDYMLPIISNTITKSIKGLETGASTGGPATTSGDDAKGASR